VEKCKIIRNFAPQLFASGNVFCSNREPCGSVPTSEFLLYSVALLVK